MKRPPKFFNDFEENNQLHRWYRITLNDGAVYDGVPIIPSWVNWDDPAFQLNMDGGKLLRIRAAEVSEVLLLSERSAQDPADKTEAIPLESEQKPT